MVVPMAPFVTILDRVRGWHQQRRKVQVLAHRAFFIAAGPPGEHLFVKITNLSRDRPVEVTHVWVATDPERDLLNPHRRLPVRLAPDETDETWVAIHELPATADLERLVRVRLSNGKTVKSRPNKDVRPQGYVAGSPRA